MTQPNTTAAQRMVSFCQELIRTPSPTGEEGLLAKLIAAEMKELGYDEVRTDEVGNVIGTIRATDPTLPSILFTAHMDQVSPGDLSLWDYDPFGGESADGWIHGRGASDTKGAIATQVHLPTAIAGHDLRHGDLHVAQVVVEEVAGLGSRILLDHLHPDYTFMGEGTTNELSNGNRGRTLVRMKFPGTSVHASISTREQVALYRASKFLLQLADLPMKQGVMGSSHAVPTRGATNLLDDNVTPQSFDLSVDWRSVPGETPEEILERLASIMSDGDEAWIPPFDLPTYTGKTCHLEHAQPPYWIDPNDAFVVTAQKALSAHWNRDVPVIPWRFTTDCGLFTERGFPILGFSPCEAKYAHTPIDRVSIDLMIEAWEAYPALIKAISTLPRRKA